jgi:histidinol phosphatase-like PHP family hydrolase
MYDLHTHTIHSDGELLPTELIRRAQVLGYDIIAITDHADRSNISQIIRMTEAVRKSAEEYGVRLVTGVEITHVPPREIPELARLAKNEGAGIVIVHGETVVEPVMNGTNSAACGCEHVDILAHPGLISEQDATLAASNGIFLEITSRGGHNRTNGHVCMIAEKTGCRLAINSDTHNPGDLMSAEARKAVVLGAGLNRDTADKILSDNNIKDLLNK